MFSFSVSNNMFTALMTMLTLTACSFESDDAVEHTHQTEG